MPGRPGDYDVVIVGARVAGAPLATHLAAAGMRVAVVDRAAFPSDTVSTHVVYPNTLARLERLGVLDEILAHGPPPLWTAWHHAGVSWEAAHTPVAGRDWALCVRRTTLDKILVDRARRAGAEVIERFSVVGLVGRGTEDDPVAGVVGRHGGEERVLRAALVVGADGTGSTVARLVGSEPRAILRTGTAMMYSYWRGMPERRTQDFFLEPPWIGTHFPADGGHHLVILIAPVEEYSALAKDDLYGRRVRAMAGLRDRLRGAEQVAGVVGTRRLDGFYRDAAGPGWALIGDAGHFKHPAAVQGIADAIEGAEALAAMIADGTEREALEPWRDERTREMYAFSRWIGEPPAEEVAAALMGALAANDRLARDFVDIWSRERAPWEVIPRVPGLAEAAGASAEEVLAPLERVPVAAGRR